MGKTTTRLIIAAVLLMCNDPIVCKAQSVKHRFALGEVIELAQEQSIDAMVAYNSFLTNYWGFRSFRAEQLPSLNLRTELGNFDRSLRPLQNSETGEIYYRENYNMSNMVSLSIDQIVAPTGGILSLYSSLSRLDQYSPKRENTYYSQPVTLSYLQPLWSFNRFKWDRKIEPQKYEQAKRIYLESMEEITLKSVELFFGLAIEQSNWSIAVKNYENTKIMYDIAQERFRIGSVKKNELLQLELRMLNDSLAIHASQLQYIAKKNQLRSFLGYNETVDIELVLSDSLPAIAMNYEQVLDLALDNSSFRLSQQIIQLEAEREVAHAKANRGITAEARAQFGLSNSAERFKSAYMNLLDHEIFGLTLKIPIMDWGMGKGRVKVAQSQVETVRNKAEQAFIDYQQTILVDVMQFNNQRQQCNLSKRATSIADERYNITLENFANGGLSVTDLNTSQSEKDEANRKYIEQLRNYWLYYYTIRKKTLYDYETKTNISVEFDKLVQ